MAEEEEGPAAPSAAVLVASIQERGESIVAYIAGVPDVIEDNQQYEAAMAEIIKVRNNRKKAEKFFKELLQPMVDALIDMKAKVATALEPIQNKEKNLQANIISYAEKVEAAAEAAKRAQELAQAQQVQEAFQADEPMMPDETPPPLQVAETPRAVKTGTHTGGLVDIPKWRFSKHPEVNSDEDSDIYLDDPRAVEIDKRLFILDRGRVTSWNKNKTPMVGIEHFYGKSVAVNKRRS